MKTIIAGSRTITDYALVKSACENCGWKITEVVSGEARGVDSLGEQWAAENHIPTKLFSADWKKHGKAAGFIRNKQMAEYAEALIIVWDGKSKGTANMLEHAFTKELPVFGVGPDGQEFSFGPGKFTP